MLTENWPPDYSYMADHAQDVDKKLEYANMALDVNPNDLDAKRIIARCTSDSDLEYAQKLREIIQEGSIPLRDAGYFTHEYMGEFWLWMDLRPYMRAREHLALALMRCGMLRAAAKECEECFIYNNNDNQGLRYVAMGIYCLFEAQDEAESLRRRFMDETSVLFLFPMAYMYFRKQNYDKARAMLKAVRRDNSKLRTFLKKQLAGKTKEIEERVMTIGIRVGEIDEYVAAVVESPFLFHSADEFYKWSLENI